MYKPLQTAHNGWLQKFGVGGTKNSHHKKKNPTNYVILHRVSDFAALVRTLMNIWVLRVQNLWLAKRLSPSQERCCYMRACLASSDYCLLDYDATQSAGKLQSCCLPSTEHVELVAGGPPELWYSAIWRHITENTCLHTLHKNLKSDRLKDLAGYSVSQ